MTTNRYRLSDWTPFKYTIPEHIRADLGAQAAHPGFVLVSFASETARQYVEERLGPSLEPDRSLDLYPHKKRRQTPSVR